MEARSFPQSASNTDFPPWCSTIFLREGLFLLSMDEQAGFQIKQAKPFILEV
jgi:hypothetical protein